jgi:hypothetical protein
MKKQAIWIAAITNVLVTAPLFAADLPELQARQERSMTVGLEGRRFLQLTRAHGPGRTLVRQSLLARLESTASGGELAIDEAYSVAQDKPELSLARGAAGRRWFLQVRGDGTAAAFVDEDAMQKGRALAVPKSERMSVTELEGRARSFIHTVLADHVVLGSGEGLVPVATRFLVEDGAAIEGNTHSKTKQQLPRVVANRMVFGRTIDGVPVLGAASWVSVTLSNDGTPTEFEYDWPTYVRVGNGRAVVDVDAIAARGAALSRVSLEAPSVRIRSMDCGYYDSASGGGTLQPACTLDYSYETPEGGTSVYQTVIPAAADVEVDPKWSETRELLKPEVRARINAVRMPALRNLLRNAATSLKRVQVRE